MTSLAQLQRDYKRYLFARDDRIVEAVVDTVQLSARDRLEIYANAYRARLREALAADYPVLRQFLGDRAFANLVDVYVDACPSTSFTLRGYGAKLAAFAESNAELADRAFVAELASFEWALADAFDASDAAAAGVAELATVAVETWPSLEIVPHPSVRLVDVRFDTVEIWNAIRAGGAPRPPERLPTSGACLVWRQGLATVFRSIDRTERDAWDVVGAGGTFAAMCDALLETLEPHEVALRAATMFRGWLEEGLVARVRAA
jgi:hypothetical protein